MASSASTVDGGVGRVVREDVAVAGDGVGDVGVARWVHDDVPAPRPRAALVLEHGEQQEVLEPHHGQVRPLEEAARRRCEHARAIAHLQVARRIGRLRLLVLVALVVLGVDADHRSLAAADVEHERHVEGAEAVEVCGVEAPRRVGEADVAHGAGRVGPPRVHGAVGPREVGGQVAEQVEAQGGRRQEVGPQPLVVEALVGLGDRRARAGGGERAGGEEAGTRVAPVVEREPAADEPDRCARSRHDRLGADRVTVRLAPLRLVVAQPAAVRRHRRSSRHAIVGLPAVRGLELPLRRRR